MRCHPDHPFRCGQVEAQTSPSRSARLAVWLVVCLLIGSFGVAPRVQADELGDFERARDLYDSLQYAEAVEAFTELVGTDPPKLRDALLVVESRKYLAASLAFEDRVPEARAQFEALLRAEPDYAIDPMAYPDEVVQLFDSVKRDMADEIRERARAAAEAQAAAEAAREAADAQREARLRALRTLAEQEYVEVHNSRWVACIPFGIGQIQNGHKGLGRLFAVTEAALAIGTIATFTAHWSLSRGEPAAADTSEANQAEHTLRVANQVTYGTLLGVALLGIVDAQIRFVPFRRERRRRELPDDLNRWVEHELSATGYRLRF